MKLLVGLDQPGLSRLRVFKDTTIETVISTKNEWIVDDTSSNVYDINLQKDVIDKEINDLNTTNDEDKRFANELINIVQANDSFHQLNFYNRNCIHFVEFLIRLQKK